MSKQLKYPVGSKISWCGEEFEVVKNYGNGDHSGEVKQGDEVIGNFYFSFQGEEAIVISMPEDDFSQYMNPPVVD